MRTIERAPDWAISDILQQGLSFFSSNENKKVVDAINNKYLYWDKVKYQGSGAVPSDVLWAAVKLSRTIHAKQIHFGKYSFRYSLTDYIQKGLHEFDLNIGGQLESSSILHGNDKKTYLISSIMEEAIASSQIEGAVTTRKKAKEMLRKSMRPRTKSEQMIVNNYLTIKHIVEHKNQDLTEERLFEIHRLITHLTLEDAQDEGRYRDNDDVNVVDISDGEVVHTPPEYKEIPALMNALFQFFNENQPDQFIHPIIKGCIIHFLIGFFHPFVDGNGRTARALFYWYLLKNGYWMTEYLSISRLIVKSKNQYAMAFLYSEIDENDLSYFINYKLKTMTLAYESLREYIQRKINEKKQLVHFQRIKGINDRQALILKWFYEEADLLLTVKEIENRLSVSNQTGRNDLIELVFHGYLDVVEMNKKTKAFCRSSKFDEIIRAELINS